MATLTAHVDLPVDDRTVSHARAFAYATATAWRPELSPEALLVLLDELVGAVHARASGEHSLVLALTTHDEQGVHVSIADGAAVRATAAATVEGAPALAGLLSSLAERWGDEPYQGGYRLWFELTGGRPPLGDGPVGADGPDLETETMIEDQMRRHRDAWASEIDPTT